MLSITKSWLLRSHSTNTGIICANNPETTAIVPPYSERYGTNSALIQESNATTREIRRDCQLRLALASTLPNFNDFLPMLLFMWGCFLGRKGKGRISEYFSRIIHRYVYSSFPQETYISSLKTYPPSPQTHICD